ncbi:hypothetical protein Btru_026981 [Bulinus truncatus]|nr:hypothetical protein Btru_026981 [Bulinus truncatus]
MFYTNVKLLNQFNKLFHMVSCFGQCDVPRAITWSPTLVDHADMFSNRELPSINETYCKPLWWNFSTNSGCQVSLKMNSFSLLCVVFLFLGNVWTSEGNAGKDKLFKD